MGLKPRTYRVWQPDGTTVAEYALPGPASLAQLQGWVGGYIQMVRRDGIFFYVNEDGLRLGLKRNAMWPWFVGPVVQIEEGYRR